jgi:hypothetical protein
MAKPTNTTPASNGTRLEAKVSEKGALSLYGLQRFPISLYAAQWETLLANGDKIKAFIEANRDKLATKADKAAADGRTTL